jgi:hypothetical protein
LPKSNRSTTSVSYRGAQLDMCGLRRRSGAPPQGRRRPEAKPRHTVKVPPCPLCRVPGLGFSRQGCAKYCGRTAGVLCCRWPRSSKDREMPGGSAYVEAAQQWRRRRRLAWLGWCVFVKGRVGWQRTCHPVFLVVQGWVKTEEVLLLETTPPPHFVDKGGGYVPATWSCRVILDWYEGLGTDRSK